MPDPRRLSLHGDSRTPPGIAECVAMARDYEDAAGLDIGSISKREAVEIYGGRLPLRWRVSDRLRFARIALAQRGRDSDDFMGRAQRWRWTAKLVICLLLAVPERGLWGEPDSLTVAMYDGREWYGPDGLCGEWSYLAVAYGWRRWCWDQGTDGNP